MDLLLISACFTREEPPLTRICNPRFFNPGFVILLNEKEVFETMFYINVDYKSTVKKVRIANPHQRLGTFVLYRSGLPLGSAVLLAKKSPPSGQLELQSFR